MYGSDRAGDDAERTAFRKTEKKYKLYYENSKSTKKKKQPKQVDLSEVLDFKSISESFNQDVELPPGVVHVNCGFDRPIFGLENSPGFYFFPGALTLDEQCTWIRESLTNFPQPPNRTNHNVIYGPISNLFVAAKEGKVFIEEETSDNGLDSEPSASVSNGDSHRWKFYEEDIARSRGKACKTVPASVLLRKLRWSTLGLQFDWSNRNYAVSLPHNKIPNALCQLAKRMAEPAMPIGEEFWPEAAIVNYFGSGDTLGGHLDDMEADWSKPIVSMRNYAVSLPHNKIPNALCRLAKRMAEPAMPIGEEFRPEAAIVNYFGSFGCKAIFLLGGKSRQDEPLAMFLRSGDVVLMAGEARECFHGWISLPNSFLFHVMVLEFSELELDCKSFYPSLLIQMLQSNLFEKYLAFALFASLNNKQATGVPRIFTDEENAEITPLELRFSDEDDRCFLDYIRTSRININIRQVF
ncbi:hypothetical protein GOBAR_AA10105 [Gossypium barbadense]|uniref:Alpha-ketoglutarate-dependent dioxygenase AlkB-like domain-containing protein n=1 Tax=Gossypium barbadense TaxID=3634 RepID=A0A2P5Y4K1_GOSBA|nr:hypothetical protein GOBAR_AA10105 [Gossypium barbadense]